MNKIMIVSNMRMLLFFTLLEKDYRNAFYITDSDIQCDSITSFRSYRPRNMIERILFSIKYFFIFLKFIKFNKLKYDNAEVYGADHIMGGGFFVRRFPFYLIEDGSENYLDKNYKRTFLNKVFSTPRFGIHKNIKLIYLTRNENINDKIKHKVRIIDICALWKEKTEQEQLDILNFLGVELSKIECLKERCSIVYTQPLSEDGVLSEQEKIELYQQILTKYDSNTMVIKPHPREKTNYSHHFPGVYVFNEQYPSEIFDLLGVSFSKVVTLFSTAAYQYPKDKVDFYGTKIHPKLLQHFGDVLY